MPRNDSSVNVRVSISILVGMYDSLSVLCRTSTSNHKTSLGKLSRAKLRTAFESGVYVSYQTANEKAIRTYRKLHIEAPSNEVQETILDCFADILEISRDDIGISTSLFDWGVNSIETIKLKTLI